MSGMEWRYLPAGRVKHALRRSDDAGAVCGVYTLPASAWMGTGSQVEYETVERLPECRNCVRALGGGRPVADVDGMRCEPIRDRDGNVIGYARVSARLDDEARAALVELVAAARKQFEADVAADPSIRVRQEAARARNAERLRRIRGGAR